MANIKALDWSDKVTDTGIDESDVESIHVLVLTGDEILTVKMKDGSLRRIDSCPGGRIQHFYDGEYDVGAEDLDTWMQRTSSYSYF